MPVKITGMEEINRKLASLNDPKIYRRPMKRSVLHLLGKASRYPPYPPGSTYERTNRLFEGWRTEISNQGRTGLVENAGVDYNIFVIGPRQRDFHAITGWKQVKAVAEKEGPTVVGFFEEEYERLLAK